MSSTDEGGPPPTHSKAAIRAWVRSRRRALPQPVTDEIEQNYAHAVLGEPAVRTALAGAPEAPVLVYVAAHGEPPTGALRAQLRRAGTPVFVPWALPDRELRWLRDDGGARPWGLPGVGEPADPTAAINTEALLAAHPSVMVLPALAATVAGERLGQGGGYYDTLLASCPPWAEGGPLRVALVWPWEVVERLPVDRHDQQVDLVVSGHR